MLFPHKGLMQRLLAVEDDARLGSLLRIIFRPAAVVPIDALLGALSNDDGLGSLNALQVYLHQTAGVLS